jgi:hypothetical protein
MRKFCTLAAALVLPALAFAGDKDKDKGDKDKGDKHDPRPVPEVNAGWTLAPIAGVILLLSWRQLRRAKA